MKWPRVICPICQRNVAGYVPVDGDGSGLRPRHHRGPNGGICMGAYYLVDSKDEVSIP
jgi:hypothetical protein